MRKLLYITITLLIAAAGAKAIGYFSDDNPPHAFTDSDCFFCHFTLPGEGGAAEGPLRFTDTISNLCGRCHNLAATVSHQVNMLPPAGMEIPKDMPLDEQGRMTCVTCHDVHKSYKNPLTGERTYFLRREPAGKSFCMACHSCNESLDQICLASVEPSSLGGVVNNIVSHKPVMDKGHGFARFEVLDPGSELDPLSLACLDCHDDEGAPKRTSLGAGIWRHASEGIGLSHPIGVDYYSATVRNEDMVQLKELNPKIKLFNGKMGCCTCHDPYAPADGEGLVIGAKGSFQDLCFACHIK